MKYVFATVAGITAVLAFKVGTATGGRVPPRPARAVSTPAPSSARSVPRRTPRTTHTPTLSPSAFSDVVSNYCEDCHNEQTRSGNRSLEHFSMDSLTVDIEKSERIIRKLRTDMMPPPG